MAIERSKRRVASARVSASARCLLDASNLCAIASVTPDGRAYVNTAYFAWSLEFELVWLSEPNAKHSRNIRASETVAIAVYDSSQTWGKPDRGIQLFGSARQVERADAEDAEVIYAKRFADYRQSELGAYRFYLFRPLRLKLFDERELGAGMFVTARVGSAGRLAWERTEIYRSPR
jgi:uncharacterized protein YhbP (UPF0306 family)